MAEVRLEKVCKLFGDVVAVDNFNLSIQDKEFVVLVGPSGCGKTTTLRMIAGLESITSGDVYIGDRLINKLPAKDRNIAMVFQNYALYPHMTVYDNMAFSLEMHKRSKDEIKERVQEAAEILGIQGLLLRRPKQLSGGQRQRVALGRAIVRKPGVFLFDEPLSNLDAKLRVQTRLELKKLHERLATTAVYVTHDQIEAMTMGDRIVVMHAGFIKQVGSPLELYDQPANKFVAGFIGSPAMNFIDGEIDIEDDMVIFRFTEHNLRLPADVLRSTPFGQKHGNRKAVLGIRPEHLTLVDSRSDTAIVGDVFLVEPVGSVTYIDLRVGDILLKGITDPDHKPPVGETVPMGFLPSKVHLFDPHTEERL